MRLTLELSRPVTGRQTCASVAQKHAADATTRGRLERIVRPHEGSGLHLKTVVELLALCGVEPPWLWRLSVDEAGDGDENVQDTRVLP